MSLANLFRQSNTPEVRLDRNSLKDQSTDLLRSYIISGRIPPGTKLAERELADLLGREPDACTRRIDGSGARRIGRQPSQWALCD